MTRLPKFTGKELGRFLKRLGFVLVRSSGSHFLYTHSDGRTVIVPHHAGKEIGVGLLLQIVKRDLRMTREEFERFIREI